MATDEKPDAEQRLRAFFRDSILSEPGMTGEKAEMLAERCVQSIDDVLARHTALQAQALREAASATAAKAANPGPPAFDPFAFSAVSVLARKGREALLERLGEIATAEHLREFAMAQHIAIDQSLSDTADLRAAIVAGTERRIAARRAAAS
jgi:hypothetical protein